MGNNLLLVEDELIIALSQKMQLERAGFWVSLAHSGIQAVNAVEAAYQAGHQFDVVLMDINLGGGLDGIAVTRILQLMDPTLLVIFHTSDTMTFIHHRATDLAHYPYISKSIPLKQLPEEILGQLTKWQSA